MEENKIVKTNFPSNSHKGRAEKEEIKKVEKNYKRKRCY